MQNSGPKSVFLELKKLMRSLGKLKENYYITITGKVYQRSDERKEVYEKHPVKNVVHTDPH